MKPKMELPTSVAAVIFLLQLMLGVSSTPAQTAASPASPITARVFRLDGGNSTYAFGVN
jgi:hypothetical protein